jgi:dTDP-4-amino-4,6-dideoxygalactose transaminase
MPSQQIAKYSNSTASANALKTGVGTLYGIIVNSHTAGTIKIYDSLTQANTVIMNTFSFPTGSGVYIFPMGISFYTGLSYTIGGTADITLLYY